MSGRDERPRKSTVPDGVLCDAGRVYTFLERVDGLEGTRSLEFLTAIALLAGIAGTTQYIGVVARRTRQMIFDREGERNVR